jgi:hypothetical protein
MLGRLKMDQDKRRKREEKRDIKKDGNRSRRRYLKRIVDEDPENAHLYDDFEFGENNTSTKYNGLDTDSKRKKQEEWERQQYGQDNMEEEERY